VGGESPGPPPHIWLDEVLIATQVAVAVEIGLFGPLLELVARAGASTGTDRATDDRAGRSCDRATDDRTTDSASGPTSARSGLVTTVLGCLTGHGAASGADRATHGRTDRTAHDATGHGARDSSGGAADRLATMLVCMFVSVVDVRVVDVSV
jgi:hypothetical protein